MAPSRRVNLPTVRDLFKRSGATGFVIDAGEDEWHKVTCTTCGVRWKFWAYNPPEVISFYYHAASHHRESPRLPHDVARDKVYHRKGKP